MNYLDKIEKDQPFMPNAEIGRTRYADNGFGFGNKKKQEREL